MYTQCPECSTAFRVTAEVLRQAAGKVRCGGCGNAFNALEHLSEEKPANPRAKPPTREMPREIAGHASDARPAGAPDALPSGATARETIDDLPASGVLPPEAESDEASLLDAELVAGLQSRRVDEVLAESHTPLDEVLTAEGDAAIDSPEVFAEDAGKTIPDNELRFDDNTGLPDDYDADADDRESVFVVPEPSRDPPQPMASLNIDLGFDDPEEWQDLLDEVEPGADAPAEDTGDKTFAEELEALDLGDIDDDDEVEEEPAEAASRMEALSVELSGIHQELGEIGSRSSETTIIDELEALDVDLDTDDGEFEAAEEIQATDTDTGSEPRHGETVDEDDSAAVAHEDVSEDSSAPDDTDDAPGTSIEAGVFDTDADETMDDGDRRLTAPDPDAGDVTAVGQDDDAGAVPEAPAGADVAPMADASATAANDARTEDDFEAGSDEEAAVIEGGADADATPLDDESTDDVSTADAGEFRTDEIASYIAAAEADDAAAEEGETAGKESESTEPVHEKDAADLTAGDDGEELQHVDDSPDETNSQIEPREDDIADAAAAGSVTSDEHDDALQDEAEGKELDARAGAEQAAADDELPGDGPGVIELVLADDDIETSQWEDAEDASDEASEEDLAAFDIVLEDEDTAQTASDEPSIDDDLFAAAFESESEKAENAPAEPVLTPMSEEEQTINMMIDQELLAVAVTDEDGLASTIVGSKESFDAAIAAVEAEEQAARQEKSDMTVETIIMSGESAESLRDLARSEALKEEAAALIAAARAEEQPVSTSPVNWKLTGALVGLGILLLLQAIHFSRDTLARVPAFRAVLGPVYEVVGKPLAPAWEVTGWRVEKTNGAVNAAGDTLSIYTEVGNRSGAPLPYPVIGVSLLDRFEESLGSRIFEPEEYLPGDVDRRGVVETGVSFNARMQIESPAVAASGFRLNVCYREDGESLRCAIEDFR